MLALLSLAAAAPAGAAKLEVTVRLPDGVELSDDDVFVAWSDGCTQKAKEKKVILHQSGNTYQPRALVAQAGQLLAIHNGDKIQHNSFALKAVKFDGGLQKPESTHEVKLDKPGVTKVFCRIHPSMAADVLVLNNKCFSQLTVKELRASGGKGGELEQGSPKAKVWLWSPLLKTFHSRGAGDGATFSLAKEHFLVTVKSAAPRGAGAY